MQENMSDDLPHEEIERRREVIRSLTEQLETKDQRRSEHCGALLCDGCAAMFDALEIERDQLSEIIDTWGFAWMEEREALPFKLRQARNQGQDDLRPFNERQAETIRRLQDENATLRALLAEQTAAFLELSDYSRHLDGCPASAVSLRDAVRVARDGGSVPACTCGYADVARTALTEEGKT